MSDFLKHLVKNWHEALELNERTLHMLRNGELCTSQGMGEKREDTTQETIEIINHVIKQIKDGIGKLEVRIK